MTEQLHFHFSLSFIGGGNDNPLQYYCLENPRDWGAWWAAVYGVAQSWTRLKQLSSSSSIVVYISVTLTKGTNLLKNSCQSKVPNSFKIQFKIIPYSLYSISNFMFLRNAHHLFLEKVYKISKNIMLRKFDNNTELHCQIRHTIED